MIQKFNVNSWKAFRKKIRNRRRKYKLLPKTQSPVTLRKSHSWKNLFQALLLTRSSPSKYNNRKIAKILALLTIVNRLISKMLIRARVKTIQQNHRNLMGRINWYKLVRRSLKICLVHLFNLNPKQKKQTLTMMIIGM